jgi:peroxiredoxin Q/BCP
MVILVPPRTSQDTSHALPTIGQPAPWPSGISDQNGSSVELSRHRGQFVLLYFYPKDDTPGCTIEACGLRDHHAEVGAVVYGVSLEDAASQRAFIAKHQLPFSLLIDAEKQLATANGALSEGSAYPTRSSFLIAPDGRIAKVWPKVKADGHWQEVRQAVQEGIAKGRAGG